MPKINITELRQNLPAYLARVQKGEAVEVTVRGRVIARIVPHEDGQAAARKRLKALRKSALVGWIRSACPPRRAERWRAGTAPWLQAPAIAVLAQSDEFEHGDPADRIIAATAIVHGARMVSADHQLKRLAGLRVIW